MLECSVLAIGWMLSGQAAAKTESAFDRELNHHPYFPFVLQERIEKPPYLFLVVQTGKGDTNSVLTERYAANLDPVLRLFERELAQPLGLKRREDQRLVVAVLGTPGALVDYRDVAGDAGHFEGRGLYDPALNAAVLSEDPFHKVRDLAVQELSERHAFLHVCQQAWSAPAVKMPSSSWVLEALACELARRDPSAPEKPVAPRAEDLRRFLLELQDERTRWAHGRTLEELCTISAPENLAAFFRQQAGPGRPPPADLAAAEHAFYRQSTLLLHFLLEGAGRRYRPGCLDYLRRVFDGHSDWPSCAKSIEPATGPEIDGAFLAWAMSRPETAGKAELDAAVIQRALERGATKSAADASSPAPAVPARPPPTVPGLAIDLAQASGDERLAMALYLLGSGRAQEGLGVLEELARTTEDAGLRERVQREERRAAAWIELRDAFLRERLASKSEIEFTYKGKKLKSRVLGFADGKLSLEKERAPSSLSLEQIDPFELAQQIEPSASANDWARLYPYVLRESPKAVKLLKDEGEAAALKADLREDYPARLRLGRMMGRLDELARVPLPEKPREARERIDVLAAWRRDADGLALLDEVRPALRDHVRILLARELAGLEPAALMRGKLTVRRDGSALLVYEFDDPRELEDFSSGTYPALARQTLSREQSDDVPFHVEEGRLVVRGQASLRSLVEFAAPLTVRYSLEYADPEGSGPGFAFALGICDDGLERFLWAVGMQRLECYDMQEVTRTDVQQEPIYMDRPYALELRNDGSVATLFCEGEPQSSLNVGTRKSGRFFLCASSDKPVRIERLQIEGRFSPASLERLKSARIEQELARF